ncbi:glycosyltransferase [Spirosoma terrae]|uniref:Glycosyltransferase family 4 protein n=1 Tax=Spirosoma terrae TaxID=1968276 RepID=A0A6L9LEZ6_9BACT|nr:glycosyltransferase family 4 protein [Spirosoma terrae]NDU98920.1 glycosyltransferase family 4 protein [Spirosoma terrae]
MRILSIHNKYLIKGGEDESRLAEARILSDNGHDVTYYTENNTKTNELSKLQLATRAVWSTESYQHVKNILAEKKHDIVHVQNFFPLISPSIYYAAKAANVPIVQAVRNYRFLCINSYLFRDGHICETCVSNKYSLSGIIHKCYRDSLGASMVSASTRIVHGLLNTWRHVDMFVCLSEFMKTKLLEGGFPANKIYVKPNFVYPDPGIAPQKENYILYVGRLQPEKGIQVLLKAMDLLANPAIKLKIVGEGPQLPLVEEYTRKYSQIEYVGKKSVTDTYDLIGGAAALIVPSAWHEPFGRVVVEAYAKGTPVIGARIGGISELIQNEQTGLLFEAGNAAELAAKIDWIYSEPNRAKALGLEGRREFDRKYTAEMNYDVLMDIYQKVGKKTALLSPSY